MSDGLAVTSKAESWKAASIERPERSVVCRHMFGRSVVALIPAFFRRDRKKIPSVVIAVVPRGRLVQRNAEDIHLLEQPDGAGQVVAVGLAIAGDDEYSVQVG